jgi:hypothetical protein
MLRSRPYLGREDGVKHRVAAWCAVALVGCGSVADSGVKESRQLGALDASEAQKLCEYRRDLSTDSLGSERNFCTLQALQQEVKAADCHAAIAACVASDDYETQLTDDVSCAGATSADFVSRPAGCSVTVGEYESCIEQWLRTLGTFTKTLSCDQVESAEVPEPPQQCKDLEAACKGIVL